MAELSARASAQSKMLFGRDRRRECRCSHCGGVKCRPTYCDWIYSDMKITLLHLRKHLKGAGIEIKNVGYARGYGIVFGGQ